MVMFNEQNKEDCDPLAFRPICLLDAMGKELDKLITQRVFFHLLSNNHLHPHQYLQWQKYPRRHPEPKKWIHNERSESKHSVVVSLDVKSTFIRVRCSIFSKISTALVTGSI
ncbi:hypothetical protein AVEN_259295-1 [Araneus ventricosus]|uniref:Reverse transcriptase domain-containing protein n=1 Tax=Araneus ventricosus TaxID=182803 RepID=A0A4Y2GMK0_ARAVE|nr:hypothetical protein AVEN_259295-1 [Araneus ventricosus]